MRAILSIVLTLMTFSYATFGQSDSAAILRRLHDDEQKVIACERKADEAAKKAGVRRIPVAGHCFIGCPVSISKPRYPDWARRNNWRGTVVIDTIVDTAGKVVFAKFVSGPAPFRQASLEAARSSIQSPRFACGDPIYFRWQIKYIFVPSTDYR